MTPSFVLPTVVARPLAAEDSSAFSYIGEDAIYQDKREYRLNRPVDFGLVADWDDMEEFLKQTFNYLYFTDSSTSTLLMTEPASKS